MPDECTGAFLVDVTLFDLRSSRVSTRWITFEKAGAWLCCALRRNRRGKLDPKNFSSIARTRVTRTYPLFVSFLILSFQRIQFPTTVGNVLEKLAARQVQLHFCRVSSLSKLEERNYLQNYHVDSILKNIIQILNYYYSNFGTLDLQKKFYIYLFLHTISC